MNTLQSYKKEIREMFFISVNTEIKNWTKLDKTDLYSPPYNGGCINLDIYKRKLFMTFNKPNNKQDVIFICRYKFLFIPIDFKVWKYSKKLKRYFHKIEEDRIDEKNINYLKSSLEEMHEKHFLSIRKEKLNQIK